MLKTGRKYYGRLTFAAEVCGLNVILLALAGQTHGSVSVGAEGAGRTANGTRYKHNSTTSVLGDTFYSYMR